MSPREQLNSYLQALEKRLRWETISKGVAATAGVALVATLALVLITNALAFSSLSMILARVALFIALGLAIAFGLVLPLIRSNQRRAAKRAETAFPQFEERLMTYLDRRDTGDPMIELLADDTHAVARQTQPESVAPFKIGRAHV